MNIRRKSFFPSTFTLLLVLSSAAAAYADAVPDGGEFQVNSYTTDEQDTPVIAANPQGGFVVAWESYNQDGFFDSVAMRRFDAAEIPLADDVVVNTFTISDQSDPALAVAADGSFLVVWDSANGQDGYARGIYGQRFDSAGSPAGDEFRLNAVTAGDQNDAVVAARAGGGFVAVWESDADGSGDSEDLVARLFLANGDPASDEIDVNTNIAFDQEDAAVGTDQDGNFVVIWESDYQDGSLESIFGRCFDSAGTALTGEFQVNEATLDNQDNPALSVFADGSFVVVWEDDYQDGSGEGVFGRFFDSTGSPASGEFPVNSFTTAHQSHPSVTLDAAGRAVVVWDSYAQDGSGAGIFGRSFDALGNAEGPEFQVNIATYGNQGYPVVGTDGNGRFLVIWEDFAALDGSYLGLRGRRLATPIFADGFESGDTLQWTAMSP